MRRKLALLCLIIILLCKSAYSALTDDLISYWSFDTNADDDHGGNDGTLVDNAFINTTDKKLGAGSLDLDGSGDSADIIGGLLPHPSTNVTAAFWMKHPIDASADQPFMTTKVGVTDSQGFIIGISPGAGYEFWARGSGSVLAHTNTRFDTGTWTHTVVVYTGASVQIYKDGVAQAMVSSEIQAVTTSADDCEIGSVYTYYYEGLIDELGIWNRTLDSSEVSELYNGGNGLAYPFGVVDSCTPPASGDYTVDCSDNCDWSSADTIPGSITMTGPGINTLSTAWTFTGSNQYINIGSGCTFQLASGAEFV